MKSILALFLVSILLSSGYAQTRKVEMSHYIFPDFIKGTVLMKSGVTNSAMLNYNSLTEEMIFDTNGKKLAMTKLNEIDTIFIEDRKFFLNGNKLVELIYRNQYELYAAHKCNLVDPGTPAAYGGTSQTSATTSYSSMMSGGQMYQLSLPEGFETKPYTEYFLKKEGKISPFLSLRQLSKLFDDKADIYKKYTKEHKVSYENQESLVELIKYMEQN